MSDQAATRSLADLGLTAQGGYEAVITGLAVDSRCVRKGHLFAALPGTRLHGGAFIRCALGMGAGAVLTDRQGAVLAHDVLAGHRIPLVVAEDPRRMLACAAALWFGRQPRVIAAVTGTNGKTSVATFTRRIWTRLGLKAISLGTTGVKGAWQTPLTHTTPEPITLHRLLAEAARRGMSHVAMEASSHGLTQRRLDGVRLAAAAFTGFGQDHLDYHAGFDDYFAAKAGLFNRVLPQDGTAVINIDDPKGNDIVDIATERGQRIITVGRGLGAHLKIQAQRFDGTGQELRFAWGGAAHQLRLGLIGGFQSGNVLIAAGLAIASGCDPAQVFRVLPELTGVRGRMQKAAERANGAAVYVDYAHTPDALATALKALRPHVPGRLIVVFGAGGERDQTKRPLMGAAAVGHADVVFVTDDNPRGENPAVIRRMVMAGCPGATEVGDRAEAILRGIDVAQAGDAVLVAGKGHETGQTIGNDVFPFDDAEQASMAVAALDGRAG